VLTVPNTYNGIVFHPSGLAFYVAGGASDNIHIFTLSASTGLWGEPAGSPIALGHGGGLGINVLPCAAGLAISADGRTLVVANYGNDSITVFNAGFGGFTRWSKVWELDLRPGKSNAAQSGVPGANIHFGWL